MQGMDVLSWQHLRSDWTETSLFQYQIEYKTLGRPHFFLLVVGNGSYTSRKNVDPLMIHLFFALMQTARTPFWYSKTNKKNVNLQINKLGHYNNKLGFFFFFSFQFLKFSNLWPSIYNNTWEFLYKKYIFFSH